MSRQTEKGTSVLQEDPWWALLLGLSLFALVLLVVGQRYAPPPAKGLDAPAGEFSAGRARAVESELLGDGAPHPIGSVANARVRDGILAVLRRLGYSPEVQAGFACNERNVCGAVENVVARLDGREPGAAVMLAAHYDSVASGPGACDDMAGVVTVLEVARILKSGPPPRHTIVLLLEDGEEVGMLGARAFVAENPLARQVRAVINLEARGSSGPSLMFETSNGNRWLIPHYAAAGRPVTSSAFQVLYGFLPNGTDFSVFNKAGMQGMNLAFIGDPAHYHTPLDNLANASPATLQHQGDHTLGVIRSLAAADLPERPHGDAVFFDVLSLGLVCWPQEWTLGVAGVAALLLVGRAVQLLRRGELSGSSLAWGLLAWLGMLVGGGLAGFILSRLLRLRGGGRALWAAHPVPYEAAFVLIALALVCLVAALSARRAGALGLWAGVWIGWAALGLICAAMLPGVSYLFVVPALFAGLSGLLAARPGPAGRMAAALVPAVAAAVLFFPLISMLYNGLGSMALTGLSVLGAVLFSSLAPLVPSAPRLWRRGVPFVAATAAAVFTVLAVAAPLYSAGSPQFLNLMFHQDGDTGKARWIVSGNTPLPAAVEKAAPFRKEKEKPLPWSERAGSRIADAPPLDAPGPELTMLADSSAGGKRQLRVRLRSLRGALNGSLILPKTAKVESVTVQGRRVPDRNPAVPPDDWFFYFLQAMPPEGVEIDLVLGETAPQVWYFADRNSGVPAAGAALVKGRPATMSQFGEGDSTLISRQRRI
jgi:hypothetical protein